MCGICGVALTERSTRTLDTAVLERMSDAIVHRGPDDSGTMLDGRIGFGFRRLSIIDLALGHQPMSSDDGRMHVVYNGEVYNHADVRKALEARGHRYRTRCDTETVLRSYMEFGSAAPIHLRGMFAYAIWDANARELFLARDRFGVKPLYYAQLADGSLIFGSEIKAILASGMIRPSLNAAALPDYLANHAPSGEETLFEGIRRLPAGHSLRWRDGHLRMEQYWDLEFRGAGTNGQSEGALIAEYGERFRDAVRMRLMSDVPLGMFLSGGIDSASIAATMSGMVSEPIKTFSVAFAEREANELAYARLIAERFRTDHHEVVVSPDEFFAALPRLVWHEDEPIAHPSSIALNFVSRLAAQHVKVVLTGEGSDETLAGYNRYRVTLLNRRLAAAYERAVPGAVRRGVRRGVARLPKTTRAGRTLSRTFLGLDGDLDSLYFDNFAVFSRGQQARLLSPDLRARVGAIDAYQALHRALDDCDSPELLDRLLYADIKTYLQELLMKQDQMSMAASIESRVPFLDHPLVEFASRLPVRLRLRGFTTKYVLRQAMRGLLPEEILTRKKMGFPVPVGRWLRSTHRALVDEYVLGDRALARGHFDPAYVRELVARHEAGENHSERLWSLLNLEMWQRIFLDGDALPALPAMTSAAAELVANG
jgi:asparagine synthase (glutamine-hydrolysing)